MIQLELPDQFQNKSNLIAFFKLIVATLAISFAPIFIRFSETELGANATVFDRLLIFAVIFGLGRGINQCFSDSSVTAEKKPIIKKHWILLFTLGIVTITAMGLWALSLEYTTVAKSMLLNSTTPIFTSLGSWLFLGKRFDYKFLIGMIIALSGALGLGFTDLNDLDGSFIGDAYAFLSAVFLGGYLLIIEQLRSRFSPTTILLWRCIFGSLLLIPILILNKSQLFPTSLTAWLAVSG